MLGMALLVVAATLAITITFRRTEAHNSAFEPPPRSSLDPARPAIASPPGSAAAPTKATHRLSSRESFSVTAPTIHPQAAQLAEQARKVEEEAGSQLERLAERLELTGEQRRRLFPILARTSRYYDSALLISGRPTGAPALRGPAKDQEVNRVLDPRQKDQLIEDSLDELALWQEIIDKLRRQLDEETPQIKPAVEPAQPQQPTPPARGRGNLFDRIER